MLRGDNIICGTSTTGTGTLTLAASPGPPGGIDFDVFARATGIGFGNSAAILVSYTIIEYTDSTFATMKSHEKGIGTLTLGGSSGIANCTLARTTIQTTATSLDSQPATQNIGGAGFSIATAANTLVFIGASAADVLALNPYAYTGGTDRGVQPLAVGFFDAAGGALTTAKEIFTLFVWGMTMRVKTVFAHVSAAYTGGTSNLYGRLYAIGTDGRAGKLLIDFAGMGTSNSSLSSVAIISSNAHANGFLLTPGTYYLSLCPIFSGGSGTPTLYSSGGSFNGYVQPGNLGADGAALHFGLSSFRAYTCTSGNATAPDAANTTGFSQSGYDGNIGFSLRAS